MNIIKEVKNEVNVTSKTILLIDDEVSVREIVELCLKDLGGWNVVIAESPLDGLQTSAIIHPDAIIMDLAIRNMNSLRFLEQLRNNPQTMTIPLVLLSAKARWIDPHIIQKYQIAGVILKPFDPVTIPFRINALLQWT